MDSHTDRDARDAAAAPEALRAYPPETLEGWYSLHQIFSVDHAALRKVRSTGAAPMTQLLVAPNGGWSSVVHLIGSKGDVMVIHFRPTLDEIGDAQRAFARHPLAGALRPEYSFLSVTEAGLYRLTAQLAKAAKTRGGAVGDETYVADLAARVAAERENAHVRGRLYPSVPGDMPYVCFYPMSKRRDHGQNWYTLSLEERSRLMWEHGLTGRRYAGRVLQIIAGAIGFDAWEWGVTLFARDPMEFKKIVTEMRFDEVSARYSEFGDFYVGKLLLADEVDTLGETLSR